MSAVEVIEQIKALTPEEKAEVVDFVRRLEPPSNESPGTGMDRPALEATAERIFDRYDALFRKLAK